MNSGLLFMPFTKESTLSTGNFLPCYDKTPDKKPQRTGVYLTETLKIYISWCQRGHAGKGGRSPSRIASAVTKHRENELGLGDVSSPSPSDLPPPVRIYPPKVPSFLNQCYQLKAFKHNSSGDSSHPNHTSNRQAPLRYTGVLELHYPGLETWILGVLHAGQGDGLFQVTT